MASMGGPPLPETCHAPATVWLGAGHAAYRGPSLRLGTHSGSVLCLAVGIDGEFTVRAEAIGERAVRSLLVPPRTPHRLVADTRMLFCYLDPGSPRAAPIRTRMRTRTGGFGIDHIHEDALLDLANDAEFDPAALLDLACGASGRMDPRIATATAILCANPALALSADQLAATVHLSKSRFLHLFSAQAGTTFRRYRLWARMLAAGRAIAAGTDLTTAATQAGFASPSHFSDTFRTMFGLTATDLLAVAPRIICEEEPGENRSPVATST